MRHSKWLALALSMTTLAGVATGCGGSTSGGESAAVELEQSGAVRCDAACETIARCDLAGQSCDCACDAGEACDCTCDEQTPAECTARCSESVTEVLEEDPGCADAMLALLTCLQGATCEGETTCWDASRRVEECRDESDPIDDEPVSGGSTSDPGSAAVVCKGGSGSGTADPQTPGSVMCTMNVGDCSDGNDYGVECRATSAGDLACTCLVNGAAVHGVSGRLATCPTDSVTLGQVCGWGLI